MESINMKIFTPNTMTSKFNAQQIQETYRKEMSTEQEEKSTKSINRTERRPNYDTVEISDEGYQKYEAMKSEMSNEDTQNSLVKGRSEGSKIPQTGRVVGTGRGETVGDEEDTGVSVESSEQNMANLLHNDTETSEVSEEEESDDEITSLTETKIKELVAQGKISKSQMEKEFIRRGITE